MSKEESRREGYDAEQTRREVVQLLQSILEEVRVQVQAQLQPQPYRAPGEYEQTGHHLSHSAREAIHLFERIENSIELRPGAQYSGNA